MFIFFEFRRARTFGLVAKGDVNSFGSVAKGGEKFLILNFLKPYKKIKGHV